MNSTVPTVQKKLMAMMAMNTCRCRVVLRISRQEDVMAQVNSHSLEQVMHGLFPKRVLDTVLDAMTDHEKLSLEVLDNETKSRAFALVILKMLKTAAGFDENARRGA